MQLKTPVDHASLILQNADLSRPMLIRNTTTLMLVVAMLTLSFSAQASSLYPSSWDALYLGPPESTSDENASCQLCHDVSTLYLNEYGEAIRNASGATIQSRILAVESLDSDGASGSNIAEITASTQPGWTEGNGNRLYDRTTGVFFGTVTAPSSIGNLDIPIVSTRQDFDNDSDSDVLLRNTNNGTWRYFSVQNQAVASSSGIGLFLGADWAYQGNADFDGDGDVDVLLRRNDGSWRVFEIQDGAVSSSSKMNLFLSSLWQYQGAYDFDNDGDADILSRKSDTGQWRIFEIENRQVQSSNEIFMFQNNIWTFKDIKDYDGDGDGDVLIRRSDNGKWRVFEFESLALVSNKDPGLFNSLVWQYQSAGDMDKDDIADVVLRNATGDWRVFDFANNASFHVRKLGAFTNTSWQHAQTGDYDGDGDDDLLLRRASDGAWRVFEIEDRVVQSNAQMNIWTNPLFQLQQ